MHSFNPSCVTLHLHFASAVFLAEKPHNTAYTENSCRIFQNAHFARPPHIFMHSSHHTISIPRMPRTSVQAWNGWGFGIYHNKRGGRSGSRGWKCFCGWVESLIQENSEEDYHDWRF